MCIIIDNDVSSSKIFKTPPDDDFRPLIDWIDKRDGMMVFGGKNLIELFQHETVRRRIKGWHQRGKAIEYPSDEVDRETKRLENSGKCKSNDEHIIALARLARIRLLCTNDDDLEDDFRDLELISRPRGKIYKHKEHKKLLRRCGRCYACKTQ